MHVKTFTLLILMIFSAPSFAVNCNFKVGGYEEQTVFFGDVTVSPTVAPGEVLAEVATTSYTNDTECDGVATFDYTMTSPFNVLSSYGSKVFQTNIKGVGVKVIDFGGAALPFTYNYNEVAFRPFTVQLVKSEVGTTGAGSITLGSLSKIYAPNSNEPGGKFAMVGINMGSASIISQGCTATSSSKTVTMPETLSEDFTQVGSVGPSKNFTVSFTCPVRVTTQIFLEPVHGSSDKIRGLLNLDPDSTAKGFSIQVMYGGEPTSLSQNINAGIQEGPTDFSFSVRYYQSESTIKAGSANSAMTLTVIES